ncbi:MAG TPA: DUF1501 domain-containing protein [Verrucomicrobiales bacterium]|jgi:uncharacterized protein (DUF1501 family)|nr:DUF1501 domain-containing protein [Verrucomicrobiales bacterium]
MTSSEMLSRRNFIQRATGLTIGAGVANTLFDLRLVNTALAQSGGSYPDYKALVCIFLSGGNDGNNLVIPYDTAGYQAYAGIRGPRLALWKDQASIPVDPNNPNVYYGLPLNAGGSGGEEGAVHSAMPEVQTLFNAGKLAFVRNVGVLTEPLTRTEYRNGTKKKPPQLFSHNDQVSQWQTSVPDQISRTGWGGRTMDRVRADFAQQGIPVGNISMSVSLAGSNTWEVGDHVNQFQVSTGGIVSFTNYTGARKTLIDKILRDPSQGGDATLNSERKNLSLLDFRDVNERALLNGSSLSAALASLPPATTTAINNAFAPTGNSSIGQQLKMIARIIASRNTLGMKRQIFFCSVGGYDTHGDQPVAHANLLAAVSKAMKALYDATASTELNIADKVTSFTAADFGRTCKSNGLGSDHAWGNHHMVCGGGVAGGRLYGSFPTFQLGGPSDTDNGSGSTGRWIPTTSVDEYSATLSRWFGVTEASLDTIFPNLRRFPNRNLGFMG